METIKDHIKNNFVMFGLVIGMAWIISSFVLSEGLSAINNKDTISVTGTAEKMVVSDSAKWTFMITKQAVPESYGFVSKQLNESKNSILSYLKKKGVDEKSITVQPMTSNVVCQSQNQVMYDSIGRQQCSGSFVYSLSSVIIVESDNVNLIKDLSLNSVSNLSDMGIQIQTTSVDFFYTKLADIRVELLELASKNAKERAVSIAKSTGNKIGGVKNASQGVFQVTQKNSMDISDYGSYDTSTIDKKITAVVRASFEVK